jgi:hypothetical protein
MSTDRISPSSQLAETLRALARDRTREAQGDKAVAGSPAKNDHPRVEGKPSIEQLKMRLRDLARTVDTNNPQSIATIRDSALQEILLWEFGSDFRKDSQFISMIEAIGRSMDTNTEYGRQFTELLTDLQKA